MTRSELAKEVKKLKQGEVGRTVRQRISEFKKSKESDELFSELCFCLLTANFNAERAIAIQKSACSAFVSSPEQELAGQLRQLGHRFPNSRAQYISNARQFKRSLKEKISSFKSEKDAREWLVENVRGLGYKEASHFLRNIGYANIAIIDFHIIDLLARHKIARGPKVLAKAKYLEIEQRLSQLAKETGTTLAELDLYLWYLETGKVLK